MTNLPVPFRDPAPMLERALQDWGGHADLWVFGYGSLIWRPDFDYAERRAAKVHGWHRALKMWSRVNRGTPQCPGLVFGMLSGGSCRGMVFRVDRRDGRQVMIDLWQREMVTAVYDPRWLSCQTLHGPVRALAFTLSRKSPQHAGELPDHEYRRIFEQACGRFGSTRAYAQTTFDALRKHGIHDRALARLIALTRTEA
ncbi:gamma-glutamylcyclotransferase [Verminephrobacter aporrectodeae subsp. tuberculatae]|uniref:glutathione-specific gamma-glutamylcyclotransferase n=1 Tax=Verminephrobacter aporrectodeae subsp. tuberculatae TaxID=1110392 RepID=A0ABT3KNJ8_9BURK|nr:gamma-glutamylcyclotransferase [Verminephrobacter aporrectodeae]MCW5255031.1 gamma-glutamylcyclotransferase [Verminephrobacter aporrectodeae subsp. tuberculatae]MCW5319874.1 gamma-glutamylcyclotransferase [Verminephrobacter aporrectodeae subsp. tuberculatae]MCW8200351.1 gamma-glutamylcyclotransferase [Verminephrobacter aporrectodeae subsp. tuberculatae]